MEFGIAAAVIGNVDVGAEWIGGYSDAIAWRRGECDVWSGLSRSESGWRVRGEETSGRNGAELFDKTTSGQ